MTRLALIALIAALTLALPAQEVVSNVAVVDQYAWGENIGWVNFRAHVTAQPGERPPTTIGSMALSGFAWGENVGWINLGDGMNTDPNAHGVIVDGSGNMSGYAWGENIGWVNFGTNFDMVPEPDRPKVNLSTGELSGYLWGENVGWIALNWTEQAGMTDGMVAAEAPTAAQIASGIIGKTAEPLFADRNASGGPADAADVVTRLGE
jgi:hypothetical protein